METTEFLSRIARYRVGDQYEKTFSDVETARSYGNEQPLRWRSLIAATRDYLQPNPAAQHVMDILTAYGAVMSDHSEDLFYLEEQGTKGRTAVKSTVPLLDEMDYAPEGDAWSQVGAIFYGLSKYAASQNPSIFAHRNGVSIATADPRVQRGIAEIALYNQSELRDLTASGAEARSLVDQATSDLQAKAAEYDAAIKKAREENVFKEARALWANKAQKHEANFAIGFILAIVLIVSVFAFVLERGNALTALLAKNTVTGEFTYLSTFVVIVIFLSFAWIFRLIGRFITENFTLATDARQRQTILETFLNLVGSPEAQMVEGERVLILSALFRPAPGQSAEDAAPSSWLELMRDAVGKPK